MPRSDYSSRDSTRPRAGPSSSTHGYDYEYEYEQSHDRADRYAYTRRDSSPPYRSHSTDTRQDWRPRESYRSSPPSSYRPRDSYGDSYNHAPRFGSGGEDFDSRFGVREADRWPSRDDREWARFWEERDRARDSRTSASDSARRSAATATATHSRADSGTSSASRSMQPDYAVRIDSDAGPSGSRQSQPLGAGSINQSRNGPQAPPLTPSSRHASSSAQSNPIKARGPPQDTDSRASTLSSRSGVSGRKKKNKKSKSKDRGPSQPASGPSSASACSAGPSSRPQQISRQPKPQQDSSRTPRVAGMPAPAQRPPRGGVKVAKQFGAQKKILATGLPPPLATTARRGELRRIHVQAEAAQRAAAATAAASAAQRQDDGPRALSSWDFKPTFLPLPVEEEQPRGSESEGESESEEEIEVIEDWPRAAARPPPEVHVVSDSDDALEDEEEHREQETPAPDSRAETAGDDDGYHPSQFHSVEPISSPAPPPAGERGSEAPKRSWLAPLLPLSPMFGCFPAPSASPAPGPSAPRRPIQPRNRYGAPANAVRCDEDDPTFAESSARASSSVAPSSPREPVLRHAASPSQTADENLRRATPPAPAKPSKPATPDTSAHQVPPLLVVPPSNKSEGVHWIRIDDLPDGCVRDFRRPITDLSEKRLAVARQGYTRLLRAALRAQGLVDQGVHWRDDGAAIDWRKPVGEADLLRDDSEEVGQGVEHEMEVEVAVKEERPALASGSTATTMAGCGAASKTEHRDEVCVDIKPSRVELREGRGAPPPPPLQARKRGSPQTPTDDEERSVKRERQAKPTDSYGPAPASSSATRGVRSESLRGAFALPSKPVPGPAPEQAQSPSRLDMDDVRAASLAAAVRAANTAVSSASARVADLSARIARLDKKIAEKMAFRECLSEIGDMKGISSEIVKAELDGELRKVWKDSKDTQRELEECLCEERDARAALSGAEAEAAEHARLSELARRESKRREEGAGASSGYGLGLGSATGYGSAGAVPGAGTHKGAGGGASMPAQRMTRGVQAPARNGPTGMGGKRATAAAAAALPRPPIARSTSEFDELASDEEEAMNG